MKAASYEIAPGELVRFLATAQVAVRPSLYTFTLSGGLVYQWTSADRVTALGARSFVLGPGIQDEGVQSKAGVEPSSVNIKVMAPDDFLIGGMSFMAFVEGRGLDGAIIKIERAFGPSWDQPLIGAYIAFQGRFSEVQDLKENSVTIVARDYRELFAQQVPQFTHQPSCRWVLGSSACGVDLESLKVAGTIVSSASGNQFLTDLSAAAGVYDLGKIVFTTGPNAGVSRTVQVQDGTGSIKIAYAFPATPHVGDAFFAYPGCDLSQSACQNKFGNLANFGGSPYVPTPETPY